MKTLWIILAAAVLSLLYSFNDTVHQSRYSALSYYKYKSISNKSIDVTINFTDTDKSLEQRIKTCVTNVLNFLETNFDDFVGDSLNIIVYPASKVLEQNHNDNRITISVGLFSPVELHKPEFEIAKQITELFLKSKDCSDSKIKEGVVHYIAEKIMREYYPAKLASFNFITYYPVFGILYLSFYDVPIIYSLDDVEVPPGSEYAKEYYPVKNFGSVTDVPPEPGSNQINYVNSISKPVLSFMTIENYLGEKKVFDLIKKDNFKNVFYNTDSLMHCLPESVRSIIEDVWTEQKFVDYKIRSIKRTGKLTYEMFVERAGDATHPVEIEVYTETDTTYLTWDGEKKYKIFEIKTKSELIACTIDPERKNLLDINFANNSYTVEPKYWGSLSLAIRSFFWFQNALMILGSIA